MGGDGPAWQANYSDPLRCLPDGATAEITNQGNPNVEEIEGDACSMKFVWMHRPTHEPHREKSMEYPFSWHLASRKRLWELRLQVRFHKVPQGRMFFGIELEHFVPVSGLTRQAQKALVGACQRVVGDCYHTNGDDPSKVQGELEKPAFVMPLWAFDQFHVAEPGQEPALTEDLQHLGVKRADGVSNYISNMQSVMRSFSTDKVYTFCFWGVSKFLDIMRWEVVGGLMPGVKLDFNKLCGRPPIYFSLYEMPNQDNGADKRHLASRKRQYIRAALWSTLKPPPSMGVAAVQEESSECTHDYWGGMTGYEGGYEHPVPAAPEHKFEDLLGLDMNSGTGNGATSAPAGKQDASVDLLGLF